MEDIYKEIEAILEKGEEGALASVVSREGSAPMSSDAKMLVLPDGSMKGTVGGGCMEADIWAEAKQVIRRGKAAKMSFELTEEEATESGLICGGNVGVLVEPISNFSRELLSEIIRIHNEGGKAVLARVVSRDAVEIPGSEDRVLLHQDGTSLGGIRGLEAEVSEAAKDVFEKERPANYVFELPGSAEKVEVFMEPIMTRSRVYIFGGGHISKQIAKVASVAGLRLVIVEDRGQYANPERFPEVEKFIVLEDFEGIADVMPEIDPADMAIIVTRGHMYDQVILEWAWDKPFRYLGMIGSRNKILTTYQRLEEKTGVSQDEFIKRVRAPVGLEIGADTPGEIAVSIVAELIQVRRKDLIREPELAGSPKHASLLKAARA